jgi:hypothetical protein
VRCKKLKGLQGFYLNCPCKWSSPCVGVTCPSHLSRNSASKGHPAELPLGLHEIFEQCGDSSHRSE